MRGIERLDTIQHEGLSVLPSFAVVLVHTAPISEFSFIVETLASLNNCRCVLTYEKELVDDLRARLSSRSWVLKTPVEESVVKVCWKARDEEEDDLVPCAVLGTSPK
jgi:hypothetical protein